MRLLRSRSPAPPPARRAYGQARPTASEEPRPEPAPEVSSAERRLREAGAPEDTATYDCRCGAVFPATPTTSVSCPLCGVHQAW